MKVLQIKVTRGPNYWSVSQHKLIILKVNQDNTAFSDQQIKEACAKVAAVHPSFNEFENCGSLCRLAGYISLQLQSIAGMPNWGYLDIAASAETDNCCIIFSYTVESAGVYAAQAAVKLINAVLGGAGYDIGADIKQLERISRRESLGPSTQSIVDEALTHDIPVTRLDNSSLIMLGQGSRQQLIRAAVASSTSAIAVEIAQDKEATKQILNNGKIPVPQGVLAADMDELYEAINKLGFPLVIKPLNGNHGRGITTMIRFIEEAVKAFKIAQQISRSVIVERHIEGNDYRFLVINYKLVAVAKRTPACIIGDGVSSIKQLIDETNKDPRRGYGHEKVLTAITIDANTLAILADKGLTTESVLPSGKILFLKDTANLSSGGTADDVTDQVHPKNRFLAERIARLMDLDICGIDMMAANVTSPINANNGAVLEVNAGPGLRMHLAPSSGTPINVSAPIIDMLYPESSPARIPLVAVTGTNGKTTTVRLIAHLAKYAGHTTGFTTTDGIYINDQLVELGDCSGPKSAALVLRDPIVNFAVLECARGGILRSGLGFDKCDVSILTNISADHLGLDGIETIEELARVKAVVPKSTLTNGYAILNADDDLVYKVKDELDCNIALFGLEPTNPRIQQHINAGYLAAFVEDGYFVVCRDAQKEKIIRLEDVPLTYGGKLECMIKNVLPAILTAVLYDFSTDVIRGGLMGFKPSPENTPGRMNLFDFMNFQLMLDYAHNEGGYQELKNYAAKIATSKKTAVIAATGDRREEDIRNLGRLVAEIFDEIIIRHDKNGRGRTKEQLTELLMQGVKQAKPDIPVQVISEEFEAIRYAVEHARKGEWIFSNADDIHDTVAFVSELHENYLLNHQNPVLV